MDPEKYIYDAPGFPKVRAQELIDQLQNQMKPFNPTICLEEAVETVVKQEDKSFMITSNHGIHFSKTIIITAGNGAFQPRKLDIKDSAKFEQANLYYHVEDISKFYGKNCYFWWRRLGSRLGTYARTCC